MNPPRPKLHPRAGADGKVILVGEHAVVHGVPALAAGLPSGLCLRAEPLENPMAPHRVVIPAWDLDLELRGDNEHPVARACAAVINHCDGPMTGWRIEGDSELPSRAGLGSSATLSVALARLVLGEDAEAQELVEASLSGEEVFHGTPSGIDSAVAAAGGVIRFCRGQEARSLGLPSPLPLIVIPTGIPRSTAVQVQRVHDRLARFPASTRAMFETIAALVVEAETALETGNWDDLGAVFDANHELLSALGVSHPSLDLVCNEARRLGARGCKLTGAGGGGSLIAVAPDDPAECERIRNTLRGMIDTTLLGVEAPPAAPFRVDIADPGRAAP